MERADVRLTGRFTKRWGFPRFLSVGEYYGPSDMLQHSNDAVATLQNDAGPTKMKEIWVGVGCESLKVRFTMVEVGGEASGQVYVDGAAVGTLHQATGNYVVYEDTVDVSKNQYLQVYGRGGAGITLYVKNFRVYASVIEDDWAFKSTLE